MRSFFHTLPRILIAGMVLLFHSCGYSQTNKETTMIPLKEGVNPIVRDKSLLINPINLFIQSKPWDDRSPNVQLQLSISNFFNESSTFLWYYEENNQTNYPKAFGKYAIGLDIQDHTETVVALTIDKLQFGQPFVIESNGQAIIDNLTIRLEDVISEWSVDIEGNYEDGFSTYNLLLSDGWKKEKITYMSRNMYHDYVSSFNWKKYTIEVLEDTSDLRIVVWKNK